MNPTTGKKPKSPLKVKAPEFPIHVRKDSDTGEYVIIYLIWHIMIQRTLT